MALIDGIGPKWAVASDQRHGPKRRDELIVARDGKVRKGCAHMKTLLPSNRPQPWLFGHCRRGGALTRASTFTHFKIDCQYVVQLLQ
jgi:hypothetical protein